MFQNLLCRLCLRHKTSARAFGGPAGGRRLAEEEQLGRYSAEQSKYYRFNLYGSKVTFAAMHLR
jgi:hypothetical protein